VRSFFEELKHRNVIRVGIAYIVAGWLFAQVVDLAADAFHAPDWLMQMLIVVLLVGLPVVLFLAWAYELTPEGVKKAHEVPADAPKDPRSGRTLNILIISALVIAVGWLGWDKLNTTDPDTADIVSKIDKSIAVLPFDDFSPDGDQAWFADGLTEEILNSLARTTDLQVASRTSSFAYRDSNDDIPAIAAALGVAHILEGSVRRAGDRLRVTAQLIRTTDDKHLWSETFDGDSADSIAIQERIAFEIANALHTAMNPEELARMVAAGTRSVAAWETWLRGLALEHEVRSRMDIARVYDVIAVFDKAVAMDPGFAEAHLKLASVWQEQLDPTSIAYVPPGVPIAERRQHFDDAMAAAIKYARSDVTRTAIQANAAALDVRLMDQIALVLRLTELQPERRDRLVWLAVLYAKIGAFDQARDATRAAWAIKEPRDVRDGVVIQNMHRVSLQEAVAMIEEVLQSPAVDANTLYQSHRALLAAGRVEQAAELIGRHRQVTGDAEGNTMMRLRQACAEGRVDDAVALYASVDPNSNTQWLFLKTLGRDDEARERLRALDTPEGLFALSNYLVYRSFEARDYPLLWKTLTSQGIDRPPARPMAYRCVRES